MSDFGITEKIQYFQNAAVNIFNYKSGSIFLRDDDTFLYCLTFIPSIDVSANRMCTMPHIKPPNRTEKS